MQGSIQDINRSSTQALSRLMADGRITHKSRLSCGLPKSLMSVLTNKEI